MVDVSPLCPCPCNETENLITEIPDHRHRLDASHRIVPKLDGPCGAYLCIRPPLLHSPLGSCRSVSLSSSASIIFSSASIANDAALSRYSLPRKRTVADESDGVSFVLADVFSLSERRRTHFVTRFQRPRVCPSVACMK